MTTVSIGGGMPKKRHSSNDLLQTSTRLTPKAIPSWMTKEIKSSQEDLNTTPSNKQKESGKPLTTD
jgi:hypothetical protein